MKYLLALVVSAVLCGCGGGGVSHDAIVGASYAGTWSAGTSGSGSMAIAIGSTGTVTGSITDDLHTATGTVDGVIQANGLTDLTFRISPVFGRLALRRSRLSGDLTFGFVYPSPAGPVSLQQIK
jgi:hypothetical protein